MQADLTSESAFKDLFELYKGSLIQVLIVNHAIWPSKYESVAEMPLERWNKTISINLTSTFLVVREFLQHLGRDGVSASVLDKAASVLIGSGLGKIGMAGHADYSQQRAVRHNLGHEYKLVTKTSACVAMMYDLLLSLKSAIVEIAPGGRVNCITLSLTRMPMVEVAIKIPDFLYSFLAT